MLHGVVLLPAVVAQQECSRGCSLGSVRYMGHAVVKDAG